MFQDGTPDLQNRQVPGKERLAVGDWPDREPVAFEHCVRQRACAAWQRNRRAHFEAANGDDAQRQFTQRPGKNIDLLLTDMVMPEMSGRYFADWLRKASPQTKVVFVSGYLAESLHPGDRIEHGMFFLPKPFDPEQLATTIMQALDSNGA